MKQKIKINIKARINIIFIYNSFLSDVKELYKHQLSLDVNGLNIIRIEIMFKKKQKIGERTKLWITLPYNIEIELKILI